MSNIFKPAMENIDKIIDLLEKQYPDAIHSTLKHKDAFQLLVSTILAAQSTDKLVNTITPDLFKKYKGPEDFAGADPEDPGRRHKKDGFFQE